MPAVRAASIRSVCTCEANATVGIVASEASRFISFNVPSGSVRRLSRSKMTSAGTLLRISASASLDVRANRTARPSCVDAFLIFELNRRSSSTAKITSP